MPDFFGTDGDDTLNGIDGTDNITGGGGNDVIDGREQQDVSIYSGNFDEYQIAFLADGTVQVTDTVEGRDGTDVLTSVEYAQFADKTVNLQPAQDIVLVIDQSGSMGDDISSVTRNALLLLDAIFRPENGLMNSRVALIAYETAADVLVPFTDQELIGDRKAAFVDAISGLGVFGGTENVSEALLAALDGRAGAWRPEATIRRVILFTDEPGDDRRRLQEVYDAAVAAYAGDENPDGVPVAVTAISIGDFATVNAVLEQIAQATGGDLLTTESATDLIDVLLGSLAHATDLPDFLSGTVRPNLIDGLAGDDTLDGLEGNDTLLGGAGEDRLIGGFDDDVLVGHDDNDLIEAGAGADRAYGGLGDDMIAGHRDNDRLHGNAGNDTVEAGLGNDQVFGGEGDDFLSGNQGDDYAIGHAGDDRLLGVSGNDTLRGAAGNDTALGGEADDIIFGGADDDALTGGAGNDDLRGGDGADIVLAGDGDDRLTGGGGDDSLTGGQGADVLFGSWAADRLDGGAGADTLAGEAGADTLTGGKGADVFVFSSDSGQDRVTDFNALQDVIRIIGEKPMVTVRAVDEGTLVQNGSASLLLEGVGLSQDQIQFDLIA